MEQRLAIKAWEKPSILILTRLSQGIARGKCDILNLESGAIRRNSIFFNANSQFCKSSSFADNDRTLCLIMARRNVIPAQTKCHYRRLKLSVRNLFSAKLAGNRNRIFAGKAAFAESILFWIAFTAGLQHSFRTDKSQAVCSYFLADFLFAVNA